MSYSEAVIALLVIAGLAVLGTAVLKLSEPVPQQEQQAQASATNATSLQNTPENFQQFVAAETSDKCATPQGYTDEQWREHMGHHPDNYAECLQ